MIRKAIGRAYLGLLGWKTEGELPPHRKFVLIAYPHTSAAEFPILVAASWVFGVRLRWLGKHSMFRGPLGWLLSALGGIPVIRSSSQNLVEQLVERFDAEEDLMLAIPPEGTRGHTDHWRSGFYHICVGAGIPCIAGVLNFDRKRAGFGPEIPLTGDVRTDMDRIRATYAEIGIGPRFPERLCLPRLRAEEADAD